MLFNSDTYIYYLIDKLGTSTGPALIDRPDWVLTNSNVKSQHFLYTVGLFISTLWHAYTGGLCLLSALCLGCSILNFTSSSLYIDNSYIEAVYREESNIIFFCIWIDLFTSFMYQRHLRGKDEDLELQCACFIPDYFLFHVF